MTDLSILKRNLTVADRHVAKGEAVIARQHRNIADLERIGANTTEARTLLATLVETQPLLMRHRDQLMRDLLSRDGPEHPNEK